jgi:hypothetical protein
VSLKLRLVPLDQRFHRLQLYDHRIIDDQISARYATSTRSSS